MLENRDPAIKLFGRTIQLPANGEVPPAKIDDGAAADSVVSDDEVNEGRGDDVGQELVEVWKRIETMDEKKYKKNDEDQEMEDKAAIGEQLVEDGAVASENETSKTPLSAGKEAPGAKLIKAQDEQSEANNPKEKAAPKKPDKILPCPRCNSMDTKFCYFNNYNVNQPRHFCKHCQRYWTAGGTMRNVRVGAGRRKNKSSANHYRHITVSDAMQAGRSNHRENVAHRIPLNPNATFFSFTPDAPLCESMTSSLKLAEKGINGFHAHEEPESAVPNGVELRDEQSNGSSVAASAYEEQSTTTTYPAFTQIPCFPPPPWPYPWNPAQWRIPMPQLQAALPLARPPSLCTSNFHVPFFPATAYWGCAMPPAWSFPWISPPSPTGAPCGSGSDSPTLGKLSREENAPKQIGNDKEDSVANENNSERYLWIPKTLRIDDPGEAAKSSIWTTLGFNTEKGEGISAEGMFRAFQSNVDERNHTMGASHMLHANPAALSRSLSFRESS